MLSNSQIEGVCIELLTVSREVSVRDVERELKRRYAASGRRERVADILRRAKAEAPAPAAATKPAVESAGPEIIAEALARAARAEELERRHQDFWAERYAQKCEELEMRYRRIFEDLKREHSERYLRVHQRVMELQVRLARYEAIDPGFEEVSTSRGLTPGVSETD
jgi:hypothetical protein